MLSDYSAVHDKMHVTKNVDVQGALCRDLSARARYDAGFRVLQYSLLCFFQYYHVRYIIYPAECFFGLAPMHTQLNAAQLATSP